MNPDMKDDIPDRYIRMNGSAERLPDRVRVMAVKTLEMLNVWNKLVPIHGVDEASVSAIQVFYKDAVMPGANFKPLRTAKTDKKKKTPDVPPGTALQ